MKLQSQQLLEHLSGRLAEVLKKYQIVQDSSGGKVQDSKSKSPLDPFGGGPSGETATSKAETLIEKAEVNYSRYPNCWPASCTLCKNPWINHSLFFSSHSQCPLLYTKLLKI